MMVLALVYLPTVNNVKREDAEAWQSLFVCFR